MFNSWILDTPYKELILGNGRGMRSWQRPEISGFNMNGGAVCVDIHTLHHSFVYVCSGETLVTSYIPRFIHLIGL